MKSKRVRMILRVTIILLFVALFPEFSAAQEKPDTPWRLVGSSGLGGLYENVGVAGSLEVSHGHLVAEARYAAMLPDGGNETNWALLPRETLTDCAIMAGYGFFGKKAFAQFCVGPAYAISLTRGTTLLQTDYAGFLSLFGSNSRTYDSAYQQGFGYTVEAMLGINFGSFVGTAFRMFYTRANGLSYSGLFLDMVFGELR